MYLWGLTLTRDISAHVFAFTGLFLLLPARGRALTARRLFVAAARARLRDQHPPRRRALPRCRAASWSLCAGCASGAARRAARERGPASPGSVATGASGSSSACRRSSPTTGPRPATRSFPTQGMELPAPPALPPPVPSAAPPAGRGRRHPKPGPKVGFPSPGWHGGTSTRCRAAVCGWRISPPRLPASGSSSAAAYSPFLLGVRRLGHDRRRRAAADARRRRGLVRGRRAPLLRLLAPAGLPLPHRRLRLPPHARSSRGRSARSISFGCSGSGTAPQAGTRPRRRSSGWRPLPRRSRHVHAERLTSAAALQRPTFVIRHDRRGRRAGVAACTRTAAISCAWPHRR